MKKIKFFLLSSLFIASCSSTIEVYRPQLTEFSYNIEELESKSSPSREKENVALALLNNKLYAIGGSANNVSLADNEVYDIKTDKWELKTGLNNPRDGIIIGAIGSKIFSLGGFNRATREWSKSLDFYDVDKNSWENKSQINSDNSFFSATLFEKKIYVAGGLNKSKGYSTNFHIYDSENDSWITSEPMSYERAYCGISSLNNKIYVFGGINNSGLVNTVEEFNIKTNKWKSKANMSIGRKDPKVVSFQDSLFIIGGLDADNKPIDKIDVYNPRTDKWSNLGTLPFVRSSFGLVQDNSKIYILGGKDKDNKEVKSFEITSIIAKKET